MTLFQRAHDIVQAKANKALDAAEKPDEISISPTSRCWSRSLRSAGGW